MLLEQNFESRGGVVPPIATPRHHGENQPRSAGRGRSGGSVKQSAGILMYKLEGGELRVLLVHPGGPLFTKRDLGWWTIPKGEFIEGEEQAAAAAQELREEAGAEGDEGA